MQKGQKLKTKVRFTSLDVAAIVSNLQILIGMRATNIYDINPSTYLIKIAKSQEKHYLLIQNGVRFHTTNQKPNKKNIPSGFTMKFRKFLRSKRLQSIRQVGVQRVVVFTFGSQNFTNHLILELYSQGNIILTDNNYRILQCIRSHQFNQKIKTAVGQIYPFEYAANIYLENIDISQNKIDQILDKEQKNQDNKAQETINVNEKDKDNKNKKNNKKDKKKTLMKLKDFVFKLIPCLFPLVIQHILLSNQKNPQQKVSKQNKQIILQGAKISFKFLKDYLSSNHRGYLFQKQLKQQIVKQGQSIKQHDYFEFSSYKNVKYLNSKCYQFATFNEAVEQYFLHYKKTQHQQEQQFQQIAWKKYDQIKKDQNQRVKKLQQQQDIYKLKAEYIQKNIHDIDAIIKIIKTMQDHGYSWDDMGRMINQSKKNGDPLANMIHQINILKRQVTILLGDPIDEQQMFQLLPVEINIDYNAYTNATLYYQSKKKNYQKQQRTKQASQQVLKLAQKDALKKIQKKKNEVLAKNMPQRKVFWFEKFNWFISSQGYLVISGRDSHQNELVVKRYMKSGDLYMHSDYGGAASTVIKKARKDIPIPHSTLQEAAIFTVCRSKAWDTKILSGAWWVYHDQVSKSAPTGQFLPTGSFMIRGKRNFIQPNRMEMGITLLFKVDNQSAQRHLNDRRIHEQQLKKQEQQSKRPQISQSITQQQQFAIVSIDTQTRKQRQQQMKKQKKDLNLKKQDSKLQSLKQQIKQTVKQSDGSDNQDQDDSDQEKLEAPKTMTKKQSQTNKNSKNPGKDSKKEQIKEPQQKHKQRNKKKLKKLQKYLQEQDQDEREIIMKMLGAKQMKHMKEQVQEQIQQKGNNDKNNKKKKKDKKNVKKGINKYIDMQSDEQQMKEKLNPDKVLFLKDKKKQEQQDKKLMQNSSESEEQPQKTNENNQQNITQINQSQNINLQEPQQKDLEEEEEQDQKQEQAKQENVKPEQDQEIDQKILDSQLGQLYKLVGRPHPEDKFDCLVAMCAPYNSIKQNKYKIKLVPGGLKKGKAARNILGYFLSCETSEEDKILLKSIPQQELINAVIGNVKLAGAGLLKIQMKQKQDKKQKRKQQDNKKKEAVD